MGDDRGRDSVGHARIGERVEDGVVAQVDGRTRRERGRHPEPGENTIGGPGIRIRPAQGAEIASSRLF